jgi:hypothetical protein
MYAVEFQATIKNGIVRIPKEYKDLQEKREVRFFIMYDSNDKYRTNTEKRKKKMSAISIDTIGFKFDRDEAHERLIATNQKSNNNHKSF